MPFGEALSGWYCFSFACLRWKYSPCGRLLCTITVGKSEKLISSSYSRGDILVLYQAIKSWDTAYLGGALLDAAITAVEAVCFLVTPLFLFLPWVLYGVIAKWFGLPAVISF